ncbi:1436_t:CDS:2 [Racocetra fulgida]|uniref:1436_t:CDS:1 n=1 Tax=Racocetra fulgida TaxID=60492 RepID=A0A9N9J6G5_9GLOM|nr:1436_t:CDS:2 [Racocetra fulgida]
MFYERLKTLKEIAEQSTARKLEEYDRLIKEAKNDRERLEVYERKLITLTAQLGLKDDEIKENLTNWQITFSQLKQANLQIKQITDQLSILEADKAELQAENNSKARQITNYQTTQLELRQQLEAKDKEIQTEINKKRNAEDQRDQLTNENHTLKNN